MGRSQPPPRITVAINMSLSDLYNLLAPAPPGPSDPHQPHRISPAPSLVRSLHTPNLITSLNTTDIRYPSFGQFVHEHNLSCPDPALYDPHVIVTNGEVENNPLDLSQDILCVTDSLIHSEDFGQVNGSPTIRTLTANSPRPQTDSALDALCQRTDRASTSSSSSFRPSTPPISFPASMMKRMIEALESIATHTTHRCSCSTIPLHNHTENVMPSSTLPSPPVEATSITTEHPKKPPPQTVLTPRRSSMEDVIDSVATDTSIKPTFRPTSKRPLQRHRHVSATHATGRPPKRGRRIGWVPGCLPHLWLRCSAHL